MRENERSFIAAQSERAYAEIGASLQRLNVCGKNALNVEAWGRQAPWFSVSAAFLIGFSCAVMLKSSAESLSICTASPKSLSASDCTGVRREWRGLIYAFLRSLVASLGMAFPAMLGLERHHRSGSGPESGADDLKSPLEN